MFVILTILLSCVSALTPTASGISSSKDNRDTVFSLLRSLSTELREVKNKVIDLGSDVGLVKNRVIDLGENVSLINTEVQALRESDLGLQSKIQEIQSDVGATRTKVDDVKTDVGLVKSKQDKMAKDVSFIKGTSIFSLATFVGDGYQDHYDDFVSFFNIATAVDCLQKCYTDKRSVDTLWNGVVYWSDKQCNCFKGDTGHHASAGALHYKFV